MVFGRGVDLDYFVDKYIEEHLEELKEQELACLEGCYSEDEKKDEERAIKRIKEIKNANDYREVVCDGIDYVENIVKKDLQDKFYDVINLIQDKVSRLIEDKEKMSYWIKETCSWGAGDFPSHYLTIRKEDEEGDFEDKVIRICDNHDNGHNNADLEIDFLNVLKQENYYDRDLEDLVSDLEDYF